MPYPNYMMLEDSEGTKEAGIEAVRATNGLLRVRKLFSADKMDFVVVHMLTRAERDALQAFYVANVASEFAFVWPGDGATYTCRFSAAPQFSRRGLYYYATVRLSEV